MDISKTKNADTLIITPSTTIKESMTLGELEKSGSSSVWVLNNSNPKGNVNLTMNDGQGAQMVVTVPVTWIPVDLTTQATKSALLASPNFRRLLAVRMLILVSEDVASATMAQPAASKEAGRVYSRVQDMVGAVDTMPKDAQRAVAESSGVVSGMVMQLAAGSEMDEEQVLTTVQGQRSTMTQADLQYLAENSQFSRVKEYAAAELTNV